MKLLLGYWLIGCILNGLAIGARANDCPHDEVKAADVIVFVATWPVTIGYVITRDISQAPLRECKSK